MTDTETAAVLRLFGLRCKGCTTGVGWNETDKCDACNGVGYSLKEATRETWPFYELKRVPVGDRGRLAPRLRPYMPNFHTDAAAAVRLAEETAQQLDGIQILPPCRCMTDWSVENIDRPIKQLGGGETLGSALLSALTAPEEKSRG